MRLLFYFHCVCVPIISCDETPVWEDMSTSKKVAFSLKMGKWFRFALKNIAKWFDPIL